MKKRLSLILASVMLIATVFSACGNSGGASSTDDSSKASTTSTATTSKSDSSASEQVAAVDTPYAEALIKTDKFGFAKQKNSIILNLAEGASVDMKMAYGKVVPDEESLKRYPENKLFLEGVEQTKGIFFQHDWDKKNVYITCDVPTGTKSLYFKAGITDGVYPDYKSKAGAQIQRFEFYAGAVNDDNYGDDDALATIDGLGSEKQVGDVHFNIPEGTTQITVVKVGPAPYCHMCISQDSIFKITPAA